MFTSLLSREQERSSQCITRGFTVAARAPHAQRRVSSRNWHPGDWGHRGMPSRNGRAPQTHLPVSACIETNSIASVVFHLPLSWYRYLVKQLVDPSAQIRRISCWSLSRYAAWVFKEENGVSEEQLQELVQGIMMRVLDRHKLVQEAACSALTSIQGHASARLVPYATYLLRNLM